MTPKDKVFELYVKFFGDKEHMLLAVDEIIKSHPIVPLQFMTESEALDAAAEYWKEVKQEIEKL